MLKLIVDDKDIEAEDNTTVLQTCLENDIYVPHLCYLKGMDDPPGSCRLCLVEIEGFSHPVTACRVKVKEEMVVKTDTEQVRRLQRTAFEFLLSLHHVDCRNCPANRKCELQRIAKFLHFGLKLKRIEHLDREVTEAHDHPFLEYIPDRCVLCGRCIFACKQRNGYALLSFANRGLDTIVSFFGEKDEALKICTECHACAAVCPVAALLIKT